ncbi:MAG TPA: sugar kinase, partial [Thermoanaerobaculia bacterium]
MPITVVGSVAFDALQTPFGKVERCLGGSATYFSVAASFFTEVDLVAVVGDDFSEDDAAIFRGRNINTDGLHRVEGEKTFFWSGEYGFDLNVAKTRETQLNVFANFRPELSERQRNADVLFLANIQPDLQHDVLHQ